MTKIIVAFIILAVVAFVAYVSVFKNQNNTPTQTQQSQPVQQTPTQTSAPKTISVNIQNFLFNQDTVTVKAGDKVVWINHDGVPHTVTSDTGEFKSGIISPGQTFSFTFANAGTFSYHCSIHPSMHGSVTVQ